MYLGDFKEDGDIFFKFTTRAFATGVPTSLLGSPVLSVYKDEGEAATEKTTVETYFDLDVDHDGIAGWHNVRIDLSGDAFFATGADYSVVITTGTVDGVNVFGENIANFSIENRSMGQPAGATLAADIAAVKAETALIVADTGELQTDDVPGLIATAQADLDIITGAAGALLDPAATSAQLVDDMWDEAIEDHDTQGTMGWMAALGVYAGPDGPGIYIDSGAANTNTVVGTDGTEINPVSTFAAARTLADALGLKVYYLEGNSDITLAATHVDWEFIGIGSVADNIVNLGSQDVSRSLFRNLTIEGTQGGSARITARDCALQDPGAGDTMLHIFAERCGIVDRIQVDASEDNVFDQCYSLVAGTSAPIIQATGASGTLAVRHYSGGMEFESLSASHNVTWEGIGQVIFNADCNVNANVSVRGIGSITDNTAGMLSLTETSLMNMPKVNAEVDNALNTAIPGGPTADSINERVKAIDDLTQTSLDVVLSTRSAPATAQDINMAQALPGSPTADTVGDALKQATREEAIKKNAAFSNFEFLVVDSTDHVTPKTGLTVTGQRSIDGGAFAGVDGAIAEVANGIYQFDALAADTNGDLITWRFSSAGADDVFFTFKTVA